ncbi:MAG TPA: response regulator transcription factor [Phototrophicaceae bacterium]|nr:response regulator transcription factor [Phototrophicaceae bacterium]
MASQVPAIRVLIVDDHDMLRSGLALFIQTLPDLLLVGEASSGLEALAQCARLQPDIVLMDLMMPEMDGVAATRQIREQFPAIRIIALSTFADENLVTSALNAGVISYLIKNASIDTLAKAIREAYVGKATFAPEAALALANAAHRPTVPSYPLSKREEEVLRLMFEGQSNIEIAERLMISISTVKKHVSSILAKLEVGSRTEAVSLSVRHHLVTDDSLDRP